MPPLALLAALGGCRASVEAATATAAQAQQMLDAGQPAAAQELILKAIGRRDDVAAIYLTQARIALALNNRGMAYLAYSNALALEATNREALMGVAQLGIGTGHLPEAERAADQILSLDPQQTNALLIKAIVALVRSDYDGVIGYADQALKTSPNDIGSLIIKSRALALRGETQQALELMQAGVKATGYTPEMTMSLAELYRAQGEAQPYLDMLWRLKGQAPANIDYRFDLVEALYKQARRDDARNELASLLTASLKDRDAIDRVIRLWYGYDPEGLTSAQVAEVGKTVSLEARMAIARFFIATGRPELAIELLRPIATGWSTDVQALFARAGDAAGQGGAAAAADRILVKDPENGDALLIRARHAIADGRPDTAIVDLQRVVSNYPGWNEGYLALANAYAAADKPVGVRRAFEQGIAARPQSYVVATAYVERLFRLGDQERAVQVARQFALDSPALTRGWQLYAATCARSGGGDCRSEAETGLARSRKRFGLDPAPGTPPPIALIGRIA